MRHHPRWLRNLGNTGNGVFAVDSDHRILTWNQGATDLLGHQPSEAIGRRCYEVIAGRLDSGKRYCCANCPVRPNRRLKTWAEDVDLIATTAAGHEVPVSFSTCTVEIETEPIVIHTIRPANRHDARDKTLVAILSLLQSYLAGRPHDSPGQDLPDGHATAAASAHLLPELGHRESEVLGLLTEGHSAAEIAERLGLSLLTIRSHIRNMLRKTGLHRQAQIVTRALRSTTTKN